MEDPQNAGPGDEVVDMHSQLTGYNPPHRDAGER